MKDLRKIVWLGVGKRPSVDAVGGKGRNLWRLSAAGQPIPRGFVVSASTVALITSGEDGAARGGRVVAVERAVKKLHTYSMAVRSSAPVEDAAQFSYAGLFLTVLGVHPRNVTSAIRRVAASASKEVVAAYRMAHHVRGDDLGMAVVIQRMLDPALSGVGLSFDPRQPRAQVLLFEVVAGLGEKLVSGAVSPMRWIVDRVSGSLLDIEGDTFHLSRVKRQRLLLMLKRHVTEIESLFGYAVEIEWAVKGNRLFILQARPMTGTSDDRQTIASWRKLASRERKGHFGAG